MKQISLFECGIVWGTINKVIFIVLVTIISYNTNFINRFYKKI